MTVCDVSVVIPNYNRTILLQRALASIKNQTVQPLEVIIVDDHSDAEKMEEIKTIVQDFQNVLNVKLLINERNSGANFSRNRGIFSAGRKYIAFLDSDDLWMPDKLERQLAAIAKAKAGDSRPILSGTGRYRIDGAGTIIARQFGGTMLNPEKIRRSNFIGTLSSIVVETWVARHVGGFNEALPACQDWDFFIRLADYVQYVGVREPICVYVDHDEERITLNNKKRLKAHLFIYKNHIKGFGRANPSSQAEFYRNIAEAYQMIGNTKKANLFYAKHRFLYDKGINNFIRPRCIWFCLCKLWSAPQIKAQRYSRYKRNMALLMCKPKQRTKIESDGGTILKMIR